MISILGNEQLDARFAKLENEVLALRMEVNELKKPPAPIPVPVPTPKHPQVSDLKLVGCFGFAIYEEILTSSGRIFVEDNTVWVSGNRKNNLVAQFHMPTVLAERHWNKPITTSVPKWIDITQGRQSEIPNSDRGRTLGGMTKIDGKWAYTMRDLYETTGGGHPYFGINGGPWKDLVPHVNRGAGFLCPRNGVVYHGVAGVSGNADSSHGPVLYQTDMATWKSLELSRYLPENPHESWIPSTRTRETHHPSENTAEIRGGVLIGDYVLQFGCVAEGQVWYGNPTKNGMYDGFNPYAGTHSQGRAPYCWILKTDGSVVSHGSLRDIFGLTFEQRSNLPIIGASESNGLIYVSTRDFWPSQPDRPMIWVLSL